jgi:antagonist of KipI
MSLRIIKAGVLDTIQDRGRYGYQHLGINPTGVMDKLSAQIGNILVGNPSKQAVIEIHYPASDFFFEEPALIAITGADFSPHVNADPIPCLQPLLISKYSILQFYGVKKGARAYLAIQGGFDIPQWLNSYSTHVKANAGGFKGRALQKYDEIALASVYDLSSLLGKKEFHVLPWKADANWEGATVNEKEILVLPGNEWDWFTDQSKQQFQQQSFTIGSQSDRMGYRINAEKLSVQINEEMISSAVSFGTVQLLPDGQLTILMADHQTSGGYPRVAHVISAHHSRLAQLKAGEMLQFKLTDLQTAEELFIKQQQHLLQLQNACQFRLDEFLNK